MEIYTENHPKARKEHVCHICGNIIHKGEQYSRESGKWDNEFFDRCTCKKCYVYRDEYLEDSWDDTYDRQCIYDLLYNRVCRAKCYEEKRENCDSDTFSCPIVFKYYENRINELWRR